MEYSAHFHDANGVLKPARLIIRDVPRVGDEIRFNSTLFGEVERIVWVYDEPQSPYTRVNISVTYEEGK